jgi:hypothetical protein
MFPFPLASIFCVSVKSILGAHLCLIFPRHQPDRGDAALFFGSAGLPPAVFGLWPKTTPPSAEKDRDYDEDAETLLVHDASLLADKL